MPVESVFLSHCFDLNEFTDESNNTYNQWNYLNEGLGIVLTFNMRKLGFRFRNFISRKIVQILHKEK